MDYQQIIVSLAKLAVFAVFITAIIEVVKGVALKGVWSLIKELILSLGSNHPLSTESVKILTFLIALLYCKVFDYGVMTNVLQIVLENNKFGSFLDYIGTASLVYMGAGWAFDQFMAIQKKYTTESSSKKTTETSETTVSEKKTE